MILPDGEQSQDGMVLDLEEDLPVENLAAVISVSSPAVVDEFETIPDSDGSHYNIITLQFTY